MRCPLCNNDKFTVEISIPQELLVDENRNPIAVVDDYGISIKDLIIAADKRCDNCGTLIRPRARLEAVG